MATAKAPAGQAEVVVAAKTAWNEWLEERDRAPAEVLTDWFKERALEGLETAKVYAQAGLDLAKSRADVVRAGSALLETGGERAKDGILMKQAATRAVASDREVMQALQHSARQYQEEAAFQGEPGEAEAFAKRAAVYAQALELLGEPPQAVGMTAVEQDASTILRLGQVAADVGKSFSMTVGPEAYGNLLPSALSRGVSSDSSSSTRPPSAPGSGAQEPGMGELLVSPFPLQQLPPESLADRVARARHGGAGVAEEGRQLMPPPATTFAQLQGPPVLGVCGGCSGGTIQGGGGGGSGGSQPAAALSSRGSEDPSALDSEERAAAERRATGGFATKDRIQVWSSSKSVWLDGVVMQAFDTDCVSEGYSVPVGSLKVSSSAGTKWIRPGQASSMLRHVEPH